MIFRTVLQYITAMIIVFSLLFSGCVSVPPQVTPAPTMTPVPTVSPEAIAPTINVTSYPESTDADTGLGIDWQVSGGKTGQISKTAIIWDFNNGTANISDYSNMSEVQTGNTPEQFNAIINIPANSTTYTIYFRAYAVVDDTDIYSKEYRTIIVPSAASGDI